MNSRPSAVCARKPCFSSRAIIVPIVFLARPVESSSASCTSVTLAVPRLHTSPMMASCKSVSS
jgi:hypothetical protein